MRVTWSQPKPSVEVLTQIAKIIAEHGDGHTGATHSAQFFDAGQLVVLDEQLWSRLKNSDSYQVMSVAEAADRAGLESAEALRIAQVIRSGGTLTAPIVWVRPDGRIFRITGETCLMVCHAFKDQLEETKVFQIGDAV